MPFAPGTKFIALAALLGGLAQPSLADSTPAKTAPTKSRTSVTAVMVKSDPDKNKPGTSQRPRVPALSERKNAGSCVKSKRTSADADFSFQGFNDTGIRC